MKENKLICPFCQQELEEGWLVEQKVVSELFKCCKCEISGNKKIWQELIRTRKELDVAVDALNAITATPLNSRVIHDTGNKAIEQINEIIKGE